MDIVTSLVLGFSLTGFVLVLVNVGLATGILFKRNPQRAPAKAEAADGGEAEDTSPARVKAG